MSSTEDEDSNGKLKMLCLHGFLQSAAVSLHNSQKLRSSLHTMHVPAIAHTA
jgi:hypothetical protein